MAVEWVTFLHIREGVGQLQISTCKLFNQVYHGFPQSLRANEIPRLFGFTLLSFGDYCENGRTASVHDLCRHTHTHTHTTRRLPSSTVSSQVLIRFSLRL